MNNIHDSEYMIYIILNKYLYIAYFIKYFNHHNKLYGCKIISNLSLNNSTQRNK